MIIRPPESGQDHYEADGWPHRGRIADGNVDVRVPWQLTLAVVIPVLAQLFSLMSALTTPGEDTGPPILWGAIYLLLAYKARQGRGWARWGLTAVSILSLAIGLGLGVYGAVQVSWMTGDVVAWYLVQVVGPPLVTLILLWLPPTNRFFRASS